VTTTIAISAALIGIGVILSTLIYAFAPKVEDISIWDVGLVGGISTTALGILGLLVEVVTAADRVGL
jgi:hypothetical protein